MNQEALLNSHLEYDILYEFLFLECSIFLCIKQVGTLLYLRVVKTNTGMNPELSCTDGKSKALEAKLCCFSLRTLNAFKTNCLFFLFISQWESCIIWTLERWFHV